MPDAFVVAAVIIFAAGAISGLAGFGFALVAVPALLLVYDPPMVVVLTKVLALATSWVILLDTWRAIRWRTVAALLPWAMVSQFVGLVLLVRLDAAVVKLVAGAVVAGFALLLIWTGDRLAVPGADRAGAVALAGATSGVLSTSTGLSGPPVVLLFTLRAYPIDAFRASFVAYFVPLDLVGLPAILTQGLVDRGTLAAIVLLAPAAFAGRWAGSRLVRYVSPLAFRRVTLVLLLLTGLIGVVGAVEALR